MMVIDPMEKRVVSDLEVATIVSVAVVGTVDGAVYVAVFNPVELIVPQVGLQVAKEGKGSVLVGVPWVIK